MLDTMKWMMEHWTNYAALVMMLFITITLISGAIKTIIVCYYSEKIRYDFSVLGAFQKMPVADVKKPETNG